MIEGLLSGEFAEEVIRRLRFWKVLRCLGLRFAAVEAEVVRCGVLRNESSAEGRILQIDDGCEIGWSSADGLSEGWLIGSMEG